MTSRKIKLRSNGIKVIAPASIGNFISGFDVLGVAVNEPVDEIIAKPMMEQGVRISAITGLGKDLPKEPELNTAGKAALETLKALNYTNGVDLQIRKHIPVGGGLGSSAASAVAGAMAVNELLGRPFEKMELLPFALQGEQVASGSLHADNVAPSLLGGIILARSSDPPDVVRIYSPMGLTFAMIHPKVQVLTREAREILPKSISLETAIDQWANLAALTVGLMRSDYDLIRRSLVDRISEPARAGLIPHFRELQDIASKQNALGCSISGSGPTVFALCESRGIAKEILQKWEDFFKSKQIGYHAFLSDVNQEGAKLA